MEESGKPKYCIPLVTGCFTEDILGLLSPFLVPTKYVGDNHWGRTLARLATTGRAIERLVRWWMRSLDIRSRWLPVKAFRWFSNVMQAIPLHCVEWVRVRDPRRLTVDIMGPVGQGYVWSGPEKCVERLDTCSIWDRALSVDSAMEFPLLSAGDIDVVDVFDTAAYLRFQITRFEGAPNLGVQLEVPNDIDRNDNPILKLVVVLELPARVRHCSRRDPFRVLVVMESIWGYGGPEIRVKFSGENDDKPWHLWQSQGVIECDPLFGEAVAARHRCVKLCFFFPSEEPTLVFRPLQPSPLPYRCKHSMAELSLLHYQTVPESANFD